MDIDYDLGCEIVNNQEHWTGHYSGCNVQIMKTLADRLNQRMSEIGMTQDRLGELAKVSQTTIYKLCSGKAKETRKLLAIAEALGVYPKWLQTGEGPMRETGLAMTPVDQIGAPIITWDKPEDLPEGEFVIVPRYDIHVACGNGHVVYDEMPKEQGAAYRTDWVKREGLYLRNLANVTAAGDSMEPSIYAGDALLVDRSQTEVQDGRVYLIRFGDEVRAKRLFKRADGGIRIVSDNAGKYPEEIVTAADMTHIEIIGRIVHKSGMM